MAFYDIFSKLCKERRVSPSAVAKAIGLTTANPTYWKRGSIPKGDTLQKLADYFGVSVDYLLGKVPAGADGTGFGGGTATGSGFGDGSGYGGPIPDRAGRPISSTELLLLREMEGLTEEDKQLVLAMIDRLKRTSEEGAAVMTSRGPYYLYSYPEDTEAAPAVSPPSTESKDTPIAEDSMLDAVEWYRKAASSEADDIVDGLSLFSGQVAARDSQAAIRWYQKAAASGSESAKAWLSRYCVETPPGSEGKDPTPDEPPSEPPKSGE